MEHLHTRRTRRNSKDGRRVPSLAHITLLDTPVALAAPDLRSGDERALIDMGFTPSLAKSLTLSAAGAAILARREAGVVGCAR
jgi:hypothetical protein